MKHILSYNEKFFSGLADKVGQLLTGEERKVQGTKINLSNPVFKTSHYMELVNRMEKAGRGGKPEDKYKIEVKKISLDFKGEEVDIYDVELIPIATSTTVVSGRTIDYPMEGSLGINGPVCLKIYYDPKNNTQITDELLDGLKKDLANVKGYAPRIPVFTFGEEGGKSYIVSSSIFWRSLVV